MTKQLTQLDRAVRFAIRVRGTPADSAAILRGDDLLDAKAIGEEFERLLTEATRRADHARTVGKLGGRPRKKKPSKAALIKRKQREK